MSQTINSAFNHLAELAAKQLRSTASSKALAPPDGVRLIQGSDLEPRPIDWLWEGWLARGKMHILGGAPGTGKTTISMTLAAIVSRGGIWPDGSRSEPGLVLIWSGEDSPQDTLVPRLMLAGADMSKVFFVDGVTDSRGERGFDPSSDIPLLAERLRELGDVALLVIEPIVSAVAADSHRNNEVRRSLQPLVDLAESMQFAVLGITHFSKATHGRDPIERLTGSIAFGALARVVMVAAKYQTNGKHLFARAKSNIGNDAGGFHYELVASELSDYSGVKAAGIVWREALDGDARTLLSHADELDDAGGDDAERFLRELLSNREETPANEVFEEAKRHGFTRRRIYKAKEVLKVKSRKDGNKGGWFWSRPKDTHTPEDIEDSIQKSVTSSVSSVIEVVI